MIHTKPLAIILALAGIIIWLAYLTWIAPNSVKYWQGVAYEAEHGRCECEQKLHVYEVNQAQIEACDRQTWGDTIPIDNDTDSGSVALGVNANSQGTMDSLYMFDGKEWVNLRKDTLDTLDTMEVR
jgi:hypothetical protein